MSLMHCFNLTYCEKNPKQGSGVYNDHVDTNMYHGIIKIPLIYWTLLRRNVPGIEISSQVNRI